MNTPCNLFDFEGPAREKLPPMVYDYFASGAGNESDIRANRAAFECLSVHYRVLVDVSQRDLSVEMFDQKISMPVLVAPTAFHRLAHPEGELATARAAVAAGTVMVLSSLSTTSMEEVAAAADPAPGVMPNCSRCRVPGPLWFQLYINKNRGFTRDLVARVECAGYRRWLVTVDSPEWGRRERRRRNAFHLPPGINAVNLLPSNERGEALSHQGAGMGHAFGWMLDASLTWKDVEWLCSISGLPVLLKGICRADDAERVPEHGVKGIIVSNHGGRQMDTAPATIEVLPAIAEAVAGRMPVLLDGGVRRGLDVLKAIALGATAVLVGRPVLWAGR